MSLRYLSPAGRVVSITTACNITEYVLGFPYSPLYLLMGGLWKTLGLVYVIITLNSK